MVGGKTRLLKHIIPKIPKFSGTYFEPFLGGGAVLLALKPERAVISDINEDVVNVWQQIKTNHLDLKEELSDYTKYDRKNKEQFYKCLHIDRNEGELSKLRNTERAARFIYLANSSFQGIMRYTKQGYLGSTFGYVLTAKYAMWESIIPIHEYLTNNDIQIIKCSYEESIGQTDEGDFVYLDPPYYGSDGIYKNNYKEKEFHIDLRDNKLSLRCKFMLSNSMCEYMQELYQDVFIDGIDIRYKLAQSKTSNKPIVKEALITNYKPSSIEDFF